MFSLKIIVLASKISINPCLFHCHTLEQAADGKGIERDKLEMIYEIFTLTMAFSRYP